MTLTPELLDAIEARARAQAIDGLLLSISPHEVVALVARAREAGRLEEDATRSERHRNDLMDEAVQQRTRADAAEALVTSLRAQVEKLRASLEDMSDHAEGLNECYSPSVSEAVREARHLLAETAPDQKAEHEGREDRA